MGSYFTKRRMIIIALATAFFFGQREKPLLQLDEYQKIQQTQAALVKADLAAFHVVTALFSQVSQAEFQRRVQMITQLMQQNGTMPGAPQGAPEGAAAPQGAPPPQ